MTKYSNSRKVEVVEPQNHPLYKYTLYKVIYRNLDNADNVEITVYKRYSEFKKLYDQLSNIHINLHRTSQFPNFVKANFFDRFDHDVIESRQKSAEALLQFICENTHLHNHKHFKDFLNSGVKRSLNNKDNIFDGHLDHFGNELSLPSPILPVTLLRHQRQSLDESTSKTFDNGANISGFLSKSTSSLEISHDDDGAYLEQASLLLKDAEQMEIDKNWSLALKSYENLIEFLLNTAKCDKNKTRASLIYKRVKSYLEKAEYINKTFLTNPQENDEDMLLKLLDQCVVLNSNNENEVM